MPPPGVEGTFAIEGTVTSSRGVDGPVEGDSEVTVILEVIELPVVEPELPVTGDVAVPSWLMALVGLMGALMVAGGAAVALKSRG